jgi:5'-methylthioadenosine phosphorylase
MDIIGMTAMPEVRLAREAELCFAILALVTDYDVWHSSEEPVSVSVVLERLHQNVEAAQRTLRELVPRLRMLPRDCSCSSALQHAIVTRPEAVSHEIRERYALLLSKYLPA